jgi:hypothetical protein
VTTAKDRGYGVEINGALQNVWFDDSLDAEDWARQLITTEHLHGGVTIKILRTNVMLAIKIVRTNVMLAEDQS